MAWTQDRKAQAAKLWKAGASASEIAKDLGGVSRNAVIGILHRMGISGRDQAAAPPPRNGARMKAPPVPKQPSAAQNKSGGRFVLGEQFPPTKRVAGTLAAEPVVRIRPLMVRLLDLPPTGCRWPIGFPDPEQLFCGVPQAHPDEQSRNYCLEHSRCAYQPLSARQATGKDLARSLRRYV